MTIAPKNLTGLVVTGTDTGVGKTFIACELIRLAQSAGLRIGALKPLATGAEALDGEPVSGDTRALQSALGGTAHPRRITPLTFSAPLAPPAAARVEDRLLSFETIRETTQAAMQDWSYDVDHLLVEGVGGFFCPIAEDALFADLAAAIGFPVVVVARASLGTLNHTLLTVAAVQQRGLDVAAIVLNSSTPESDLSTASNHAELARHLVGVGPILRVGYRLKSETWPRMASTIPQEDLQDVLRCLA